MSAMMAIASTYMILTGTTCAGTTVRLTQAEPVGAGTMRCYYESSREIYMYWAERMCPLTITLDAAGNFCRAD